MFCGSFPVMPEGELFNVEVNPGGTRLLLVEPSHNEPNGIVLAYFDLFESRQLLKELRKAIAIMEIEHEESE